MNEQQDLYPSYYPPLTGGVSHPASSDDLKRDQIGFTNLWLHRRIDASEKGYEFEEEFKPRAYYLQIPTLESYRTTEYFVHNEDPNITEDQAP